MDGGRMSRAAEWQVKGTTLSSTGKGTPEPLMAVPASPALAELGVQVP